MMMTSARWITTFHSPASSDINRQYSTDAHRRLSANAQPTDVEINRLSWSKCTQPKRLWSSSFVAFRRVTIASDSTEKSTFFDYSTVLRRPLSRELPWEYARKPYIARKRVTELQSPPTVWVYLVSSFTFSWCLIVKYSNDHGRQSIRDRGDASPPQSLCWGDTSCIVPPKVEWRYRPLAYF